MNRRMYMRKHMKGLIAGMFAVTATAGVLLAASPAMADEVLNCELAADSNQVHRGDTVSVTVELKSNLGIVLAEHKLAFDTDIFDYVTAESNNLMYLEEMPEEAQSPDWIAPKVKDGALQLTDGYSFYTMNSTKTGKLYTITFKVKDDAAIGKTTLTYDGEFSHYTGIQGFDTYGTSCSPLEIQVLCSHESVSENVIKEATCTEEGQKQIICDICHEVVDTQTIAKKAHQPGEWEVEKEATCTEDGTKVQKCTVCQTVVNTETIPALGHTHETEEITKEATCTEAGEKKYTCTRCGEDITEEIPALGHTYDTAVVTKEATCTEAGEKKYTCTRCGEVVTEEIPALGHNGEWVTVKEATETEKGLMRNICKVCNSVLEEKEIPVIQKETETTVKETETTAKETESSTTAQKTDTAKETTSQKTAQSPKTGDAAPVALLGTIAMIASAAVVAQRRKSFR